MAEGKPIKTPKSRVHRHRRRAAGLCVLCGAPAEPEMAHCRNCLDKMKRRRRERQSGGLCYCGRPAEAGRSRCPACARSIRDANRKIRSRRTAEGLCVCGRPLIPGSTLCEVCRKKCLDRYRERIESGVCRCGRHQIVEGRKLCRPCLDRIVGRLRKLRETLVRGYGGRCVCCGEDDPNVIELDHVGGDGNQHRRSASPQSIYRWAIRNDFPPTLQLLCANCHTAKTRTGDCSYRKDRLRSSPGGSAA